MQLMTPTPIKALRQARSASPSSERRTGAAAINAHLFKRIKKVRAGFTDVFGHRLFKSR
jgi:hypothetical protein